MRRQIERLPSAAIYAIGVGLEKSLAFITIPLMAAYLAPGDYGRFDVAVSFIEFVSIVAAMGLTEQLVRFASTANSAAEARRCAAELLGAGLAIAFILNAALQLLAEPIIAALSIELDLLAMRAQIVAASVGSLLHLPLMWIRLQDDAAEFIALSLTRVGFALLGMWLALSNGFGPEGVLVSNAVITVCFAAFLVVRQIRRTGVAFRVERLRQIARYALPILGAGLALYVLGTANRLFLPGSAPAEDIGFLGLASRCALAAGLALYVFELWWGPKRIAALTQPGGLERSRQAWGVGLSVILLSALLVGLAAPAFIVLFLPEAYLGAIPLLPLAITAQALHGVAYLTATGSLARATGYRVLSIDAAAAAAALCGFFLFVPSHGVWAAVYSVIAAHLLRIIAYLWDGREHAPIDYPWRAAAIAVAAGVVLYLLAPGADHPIERALWSGFAALALAAVLARLELAPMPEGVGRSLRSLLRHVR